MTDGAKGRISARRRFHSYDSENHVCARDFNSVNLLIASLVPAHSNLPLVHGESGLARVEPDISIITNSPSGFFSFELHGRTGRRLLRADYCDP